jgi:hypothetical protein
MASMGIRDCRLRRTIGLGPDMEESGPYDLPFGNIDACLRHAFSAEIAGVCQYGCEDRCITFDDILGADMGESYPAILFHEQACNVYLRRFL